MRAFRPSLPPAEDGVSEVIGFLTTFSIVALLLLVAMLTFNDAQDKAADRVASIEASSAAQRLSSAAVDLALMVDNLGPTTAAASTFSIAVELPDLIGGSGYQVRLCSATTDDDCGDDSVWCDSQPCPYIRVEPAGRDPERQSIFLTSVFPACTAPGSFTAGVGTVYLTYDGTCIGLSNTPV